MNIESRITCRVCKRIFSDPRLTPCLHTVCLKCLDALGQQQPYSSHIHCPICTTEVEKPLMANGFASFPPDIYKTRLLEIFSPNSDNTETTCHKCGRKTELFSYCFDCGLFFCQKCSSGHSSGSHRIVKREDFTEKDHEEMICRPLSCFHDKSQDKRSVEFYCQQCAKCICSVCSETAEHENHRFLPLEEKLKEATEFLGNSIVNVNQRALDIKSGRDLIQQRLNELDEQVESVKNEVHFEIEKLINLLRNHEKDMFQQLDGVCGIKKENLNSQLEAFVLSLLQVNESIDFTQDLLKRNIAGEIVSLKEYVNKRMQQLSLIKVDGRPVESACVGYIPNKDVLRHINSTVLGSIASSNTDVLSTVATGEGLKEGAVGEEASFTVTSCDFKGDPCYSEIDIISINITSPEGHILEGRLKNKENGVYEASYIPTTPGRYLVDVQVDSKNIKDSPFQVNVRPPILMPLKVFGSHVSGVGLVTEPHGIAVNGDGELAFTDTKKNCVHIFDMGWKKLLDIGEHGTHDGQLNYPAGIAYDKAKKFLLVADRDNHRIQVFNRKSGKFVKKFGTFGTGDGQFNRPTGLSVDKSGRIIVTDWQNHRVQVFSPEGKFLFSFGNDLTNKLKHPRDAIFCESQNVFVVSDTGNNVLKTFDKKGNFLHVIGNPGNRKGELYSPRGLAIDKEQRLIVCDFDNHRMQFFNLKDRKSLSSFGSKGTKIGQFAHPLAVAVLSDEKIIVTDWRNNRLQIFSMGPQWKMAYLCDMLGSTVVQ